MKKIKIHSINYHPGYGDMSGEFHEASLKRDANGNLTYVSRDREDHRCPTVTAVYTVSPEAFERLSEFISEKKILSLEKRPKSDLFATDYSPWRWSFAYETTSFGKTKTGYCSIDEYKRYSGRDYGLLNELRERFTALRGEKISETAEDDNG